MRRAELALLALAAVALLCAALWASVGLYRTRQQTKGLAEALDPASGASLGAISGIDVHGKVVNLLPPPGGRAVAFLVRPGSARADIAFWSGIARLLSAGPRMRFEGYCESPACMRLPQDLRDSLDISLLIAGGALATGFVVRADITGCALLIVDGGRIAREITWRDNANAHQVAAEIRGGP